MGAYFPEMGAHFQNALKRAGVCTRSNRAPVRLVERMGYPLPRDTACKRSLIALRLRGARLKVPPWGADGQPLRRWLGQGCQISRVRTGQSERSQSVKAAVMTATPKASVL